MQIMGSRTWEYYLDHFSFDDWDQCWTLIESDWYEDQCKKMEEKRIKIIASNWMYGERHTLTNVPVNSVDDLKGLKSAYHLMRYSHMDLMSSEQPLPVWH